MSLCAVIEMSTNIRVFVQWTEQTVFAGEDVECQITFKNIAIKPATPRISLHPQSANGLSERQRKGASTKTKHVNTLSSRPPPPNRGHRTTLSLSAPVSVGRSQPGSGSWDGGAGGASKDGSTHKRSVSIISIGASESLNDGTSNGSLRDGSRRPSKGHSRAASLQIIPRRHANGGPTSGNCFPDCPGMPELVAYLRPCSQ